MDVLADHYAEKRNFTRITEKKDTIIREHNTYFCQAQLVPTQKTRDDTQSISNRLQCKGNIVGNRNAIYYVTYVQDH